jgi:hypothetical protein
VVAGVPQRNPDADLAAFDAFSAAFAQADLATADLPRGDLAVTPHGVSAPEPSHRIPVRPTPRAGSAEPTHGRNE